MARDTERILNDVLDELRSLRSEVGTLRSEVSGLRSEVSALRADMQDMESRLNRRMDSMHLSLSNEISGAYQLHEARITALEQVVMP